MAEYIEREALLQDIEGSVCFTAKTGTISPEMRGANKVIDRIKCAPVANEVIEWHKVVTRPLTEEEIADYIERGYQGYELPEYALDCPLPDDGQEILIATKWGVSCDICACDYDEVNTLYGLETNGDWDGVLAWAAMPKYEEVSE